MATEGAGAVVSGQKGPLRGGLVGAGRAVLLSLCPAALLGEDLGPQAPPSRAGTCPSGPAQQPLAPPSTPQGGRPEEGARPQARSAAHPGRQGRWPEAGPGSQAQSREPAVRGLPAWSPDPQAWPRLAVGVAALTRPGSCRLPLPLLPHVSHPRLPPSPAPLLCLSFPSVRGGDRLVGRPGRPREGRSRASVSCAPGLRGEDRSRKES